jgi:hypothetical protein
MALAMGEEGGAMRRCRSGLRCLGLVLILGGLSSAFAAGRSIPAQEVRAVADEELVLLRGNGRVTIADPYIPGGCSQVAWQSDNTGWSGVVVGDFNGDGDQEILASNDGQAQVFDPVVQPGQVAVNGEWTLSSPHRWYDMDTGDVDGDGRDEVVLLRSDTAVDTPSQLLLYDGNPAGTAWCLTRQLSHGALWDDVALGDVNGDGRDDVGLIRPDDKLLLILNPDGWIPLHEQQYDFTWLDLEMIDAETETIGGRRMELALSRKGVLGMFDSALIFRWVGVNNLADVWGGKFYPYFTDIEAADLNGDGDDELVMYRPTIQPVIHLVARNPRGQNMRAFEPVGAFDPGGEWLELEAGDVDGDGRDEVVLVRGTRYRIYGSPEADDTFVDVSGSFRGSFAIANVDGPGIAAGPTLGVSPSTLSFTFEGAVPAAQPVLISDAGEGGEMGWTAVVTQGFDWLSVAPDVGTTPTTVYVSVEPSLLANGTYQGTIRVEADPEIGGSPHYLDVTLVVAMPTPTPAPTPTSTPTATATPLTVYVPLLVRP